MDSDYDLPIDEIRKLAGVYGEKLEFQFDLMDKDLEYNLEIITKSLDYLRETCDPVVHKFYLQMYNEARPIDPDELF